MNRNDRHRGVGCIGKYGKNKLEMEQKKKEISFGIKTQKTSLQTEMAEKYQCV